MSDYTNIPANIDSDFKVESKNITEVVNTVNHLCTPKLDLDSKEVAINENINFAENTFITNIPEYVAARNDSYKNIVELMMKYIQNKLRCGSDYNEYIQIKKDFILAFRNLLPYSKIPMHLYRPPFIKLQENTIHILPILFSDTIMLPGDEKSESLVCAMHKVILQYALEKSDHRFGMTYRFAHKTSTIGTVVKIRNTVLDTSSLQLYIDLQGQQTYEILSTEQFPGIPESDIALAKIKILPEDLLYSPFQTLNFNTNNQYSRHDYAIRDRYMQTPWPSWVYKQFDPIKLSSHLVAKVNILYNGHYIIATDDLKMLSIEVMKLNVFNREQKDYLLALKSINRRLQLENQSLDNLICSICSTPIFSIGDVFNIPRKNPIIGENWQYNILNKTSITVTKLNVKLNVITIGELVYEKSFYVGYKCQVLLCSCNNKLGWKYVTEQNSLPTPKLFYGLIRSSVTSSNDYLLQQ